MKKLAVILVVVALVISMSSTVFAAGTGKMLKETKGNATKTEQKTMKMDGPTYKCQKLEHQGQGGSPE